MIVLINTTPVVELYPFQSGKLFLLHLLHGDVDLHGDDVHHVDVKHLEVIQELPNHPYHQHLNEYQVKWIWSFLIISSFIGSVILLHLLRGDVDLQGVDVHHVDVRHLEVIQHLQTIHVLIIKSLQFWSTSRKSDLIHFDFAFMMGLLLPHHLLLGGVHQQDSGVHHHKQANERSRRIVNTIPFINWYILMSIDSVYIFVTCRLSFNLSHNYFIGSLKGKRKQSTAIVWPASFLIFSLLFYK